MTELKCVIGFIHLLNNALPLTKNTALLKMIVGVLTTCHKQYT